MEGAFVGFASSGGGGVVAALTIVCEAQWVFSFFTVVD